MRVTLEFNGSHKDFDRALCAMDENFDIVDSILWELDYGEGESGHKTEYGLITIKQEIEDESTELRTNPWASLDDDIDDIAIAQLKEKHGLTGPEVKKIINELKEK